MCYASLLDDSATINIRADKERKYQRFVKLKEVQANSQSLHFCTTFNFTHPHPKPTQHPKKYLQNSLILELKYTIFAK